MRIRVFFASVVVLLVTAGLAGPAASDKIDCWSHSKRDLKSTVVFASNRDNLSTVRVLEGLELYLADLDVDVNRKPVLVRPRRLTENLDADVLPALSPDGRGRIVFDSNRQRKLNPREPPNSTDLFLIWKDGSPEEFLARGTSATWSPGGKRIAYHRSASDQLLPPPGNPSPGAPTDDSDIFVLRVRRGGAHGPKNLTFEKEGERLYINEDADWSPDGKKIAFARRSFNDNNFPANSGDIWMMNADGTDKRQLTGLTADSVFEDKSPAWSPDSRFIAYSCRYGPLLTDRPEICVIDTEATIPIPTRLTNTAAGELGPHWIPSGHGKKDKILYQRPLVQGQGQQIWLMNADGTDQTQLTGLSALEGTNQFPNWGVIKSKCDVQDWERPGSQPNR